MSIELKIHFVRESAQPCDHCAATPTDTGEVMELAAGDHGERTVYICQDCLETLGMICRRSRQMREVLGLREQRVCERVN